MRIAVDARSVFQDTSVRGIGKTLIGLYRGLAAARPRWRFDLYFQDSAGRPNPFADRPNVAPRRVDGPGDRFHAWLHFWLPLAAWRSDAALLHCHGNTAPRFPAVPLVTTIHDLTPITHPTGDPNLARWAANVRRAGRTSRRVLVPSEATAADLAARMRVRPDKIAVSLWGASGDVRKADGEAVRAVREKYGLAGPFLLHFGMTIPRKNTSRVIEAWGRLSAADRGGATLLVVGVESDAGIDAFAVRAPDGCRVLGFVPDEDVPPLLTAAAGLVYAPLSEGFGVPVLDAFACDTPLLVSDRASVPEVAGDAALAVNPEDTAALAAGMGRLLTDAALRDRLRAAGRDRLSLFTWERCAEQVAREFEQVARR